MIHMFAALQPQMTIEAETVSIFDFSKIGSLYSKSAHWSHRIDICQTK